MLISERVDALNILSGFNVMFCDLSRRKASVDENYEWDEADVYPEPGDSSGEDSSSLINICIFLHFGTNSGKKHG